MPQTLQTGRTVLRLFVLGLRLTWWLLGTIILGVRALWRAGKFLRRWPLLFRETLPCPRGHQTPVYGTWDCTCGASFDGWAFSACRVCGRSAGWVPCPECRLPVRSPLTG